MQDNARDFSPDCCFGSFSKFSLAAWQVVYGCRSLLILFSRCYLLLPHWYPYIAKANRNSENYFRAGHLRKKKSTSKNVAVGIAVDRLYQYGGMTCDLIFFRVKITLKSPQFYKFKYASTDKSGE